MSAQPMPDQIPAALDDIRKRYDVWRDANDVPRLLAALDAVLAQHQPGRVVVSGSLCKRHESHRYFSITRTESADLQACPDCHATVYQSCAGCDHNPWLSVDDCPARQAISAALLGEDGHG